MNKEKLTFVDYISNNDFMYCCTKYGYDFNGWSI